MEIEYLEGNDLAVCNGYKFRRDKSTGYYLSSRPISGKRKRLHVYVWECKNGPVPNGYSVHHVDEDKRNNEVENLRLMSNSTHCKYHTKKYFENHSEEIRGRLDYARPLSAEWHKSANGRKWHRMHYENKKSVLHQEREMTCINCGAKYVAIYNGHNKFCSCKCKTAYRKKSGVDNILRKCEYCGREFKVNKYAKRKYCSSECSFRAVPRGGNHCKSKAG